MTARFSSLETRVQVALVCTGLVLVTAVGYFVLIAPKFSTADSLKQQTAAVQAQIAANRSSGFSQALPAVRSASVFGLARAMPSQIGMPDVMLQLNQLALDSGISVEQISPQSVSSSPSAVAGTTTPYVVEPIQVQLTGSFYDLVAFLMRMRNLVRVENGKLFTAGRLFDVSDITFGPGPKGFPTIQASLTVNTFVPAPPQQTATTGATTTGTTTTTTTGTTTTTSNSTSASPATTGGGS